MCTDRLQGHLLPFGSLHPGQCQNGQHSLFPEQRHARIAYAEPPRSRTSLQTRFTNQTKLELVPENGDLAFEGEITSYTVQPVAVTSNDMAAMNRLTITVKVKFTNRIDPTFDFNRSFSAFQEYPSSNDLSSVEGTLIPELVTQARGRHLQCGSIELVAP